MKPIYKNCSDRDQEAADLYLEILLNLNWLEVKKARKELFMSFESRKYKYGDMNYEYSSIDFEPNIEALCHVLNKAYDCDMNVCFLNRYDDEKNALGWHSDDSPEVDQSEPIIVISFGAEREIWWKEKGYKGEVPKENRRLLEHGSTFVMPSGFQERHFHKIPKHNRPCGTRISLTFRKYK